MKPTYYAGYFGSSIILFQLVRQALLNSAIFFLNLQLMGYGVNFHILFRYDYKRI